MIGEGAATGAGDGAVVVESPPPPPQAASNAAALNAVALGTTGRGAGRGSRSGAGAKAVSSDEELFMKSPEWRAGEVLGGGD
jgi:hypothetical protein